MSAGTGAARRFRDEWLVRVLLRDVGVGEETVERARAEGRTFLAETLLREGCLTMAALDAGLRGAYGLGCIEPGRSDVDKLAAGLVPEELCRRRRLLPLRLRDDVLELAMSDPLDADALADVRGVTGRVPVPSYCPPSHLDALLDAVFDADRAVFDLLDKVGEGADVEVLTGVEARETGGEEEVRAPVIRLVNSLISNAVARRASDIHVEHEADVSSVRYRVDGVLRHVMSLPRRKVAAAVVARLKIMAALDISDRLRPQDGRAALRVGGRDIGLRVSTLPTQHGEKVVVRLLDRRTAEVPLDALGFLPEHAEKLRAAAGAAQGLVIVTGPTGSGKTTTLYSLLNLLRGPDVNIVTIEDPVEYTLPGINQVQVQEKQGLTFAAALRSILRQDPDVILVGEIRDRETAEIALQAALTGHLVLASLHANDAVAALTRLTDMGIEPYKIAPALIGVTAQRLVRRLCPHCLRGDDKSPYRAAAGCERCGFAGYSGRLSLLELFLPDAEARAAVQSGAPASVLRADAARRGSLYELGADVLRHLTAGDTSLEEVLPYFDPRVGAPRPGARPAGSEPRAPRALLVEDDPSTRRLLRAVLEQGGCEVAEAADGREALAAYARGGADIVVTDLHMPRMGGRDLVRRLRGDAGAGGPSVIVLTSDVDDRSQQEALEAGADDYVTKPVKPALLRARVLAALRRRGTPLPGASNRGDA